jgi:hypothetical protein
MKKFLIFVMPILLGALIFFQYPSKQTKLVKKCYIYTCDTEMNIEYIRKYSNNTECYDEIDSTIFNRLLVFFKKTDEFIIYKGKKLVIVEYNDGSIQYLKVSQDLQAVFTDIETGEVFLMSAGNNGNQEKGQWINLINPQSR